MAETGQEAETDSMVLSCKARVLVNNSSQSVCTLTLLNPTQQSDIRLPFSQEEISVLFSNSSPKSAQVLHVLAALTECLSLKTPALVVGSPIGSSIFRPLVIPLKTDMKSLSSFPEINSFDLTTTNANYKKIRISAASSEEFESLVDNIRRFSLDPSSTPATKTNVLKSLTKRMSGMIKRSSFALPDSEVAKVTPESARNIETETQHRPLLPLRRASAGLFIREKCEPTNNEKRGDIYNEKRVDIYDSGAARERAKVRARGKDAAAEKSKVRARGTSTSTEWSKRGKDTGTEWNRSVDLSQRPEILASESESHFANRRAARRQRPVSQSVKSSQRLSISSMSSMIPSLTRTNSSRRSRGKMTDEEILESSFIFPKRDSSLACGLGISPASRSSSLIVSEMLIPSVDDDESSFGEDTFGFGKEFPGMDEDTKALMKFLYFGSQDL
ncbi:MAG: hypothetical protein SGCHY_003247 [Lobulomycetales sp.]